MKEAIKLNIRNWAWVEKALLNLQGENIKTLEQYEASRKEHERSKTKKSYTQPKEHWKDFPQRKYDKEILNSLYKEL